MSRLGQWTLAIRPKTLGISVSPVLVGSALARAELGSLQWLPAVMALLAAMLIQIGTNLHNDAADYEKGADTPERMGPARATAQGWFTATEVKRAAYSCFGLAFAAGLYLAMVGGLPIVAIGLISLAAGYAYTGGPRPIAYSASGELFVFLFFGLVAVLGSYYLQTSRLSLNALYCACALGLLAAAVLLVNNYRDLATDRKAGKLTLAHYLGARRTGVTYGLLLLLPFMLPLLLEAVRPGIWLILVLLPVALVLLRGFIRERPGRAFNRYLAQTARLQLIYSTLLSLGLFLG
jgi:1,4-dihydroxy-2-naphthoate polyprenyltransferase